MEAEIAYEQAHEHKDDAALHGLLVPVGHSLYGEGYHEHQLKGNQDQIPL